MHVFAPSTSEKEEEEEEEEDEKEGRRGREQRKMKREEGWGDGSGNKSICHRGKDLNSVKTHTRLQRSKHSGCSLQSRASES